MLPVLNRTERPKQHKSFSVTSRQKAFLNILAQNCCGCFLSCSASQVIASLHSHFRRCDNIGPNITDSVKLTSQVAPAHCRQQPPRLRFLETPTMTFLDLNTRLASAKNAVFLRQAVYRFDESALHCLPVRNLSQNALSKRAEQTCRKFLTQSITTDRR